MDKLLRHEWPGNLRELSHTVRTMTLFCNGFCDSARARRFPSDLKPDQSNSPRTSKPAPLPGVNDQEADAGIDLSLERRDAKARSIRL